MKPTEPAKPAPATGLSPGMMLNMWNDYLRSGGKITPELKAEITKMYIDISADDISEPTSELNVNPAEETPTGGTGEKRNRRVRQTDADALGSEVQNKVSNEPTTIAAQNAKTQADAAATDTFTQDATDTGKGATGAGKGKGATGAGKGKGNGATGTGTGKGKGKGKGKGATSKPAPEVTQNEYPPGVTEKDINQLADTYNVPLEAVQRLAKNSDTIDDLMRKTEAFSNKRSNKPKADDNNVTVSSGTAGRNDDSTGNSEVDSAHAELNRQGVTLSRSNADPDVDMSKYAANAAKPKK